MKPQVYFGILIRIVMLFAIAMLATYLPEHLRTFFGDTFTPDPKGAIDVEWKWGARHYWFMGMMALLFLLSLANVVIGCVRLVNKHYPNL